MVAQPTDAKVKSILIYNFTKNIIWENDENIDKFLIGIYGDDDEIKKELKIIEKIKKTKSAPIEIINFNNINDITKTHVLFVTSDKGLEVERIFKKISKNNTLLITDRCDIKNYVMLNFIYNEAEKKIKFEINKPNIMNEGLTILPSLILLGGTELDVADLFKDTEKSLDDEKEKVKIQQDILNAQSAQLEKQKSDIEKQNIEIANQQKEIEQQRTDIERQKQEYNKLLEDISVQQKLLDQKTAILDNQVKQIIQQDERMQIQEKNIKIQDSIVLARNKLMEKQTKEIAEHQEKIKKQKITLSTQSSKIETQKGIIYLSIGFICVFLIMMFLIYRGFRAKKKINAVLEQKNIAINRQNEEIKIQSDKLNKTNILLEEEKRLVEKTLTDLQAAQTQLVNSEKMASLGQLTAGVAHEINNPVNYILGGITSLDADFKDMIEIITEYDKITTENVTDKLAEIGTLKKKLQYNELIGEIGKLTGSIKKGALQSAGIVKGLRIFSRLDEDVLKFTDVHENIDSTLVMLHNKYKNYVEIIKDYGDIPQIECFPGKLNQVYMNILNNAIQAIKGKGKIFILTRSIDENGIKEVLIKIRDTGIGIPENIKNKIFDPFFTTKDVGEGTGLGLSISLGIIKNHHGKIEVESKQGEGTEFTIRLPIRRNKQNK
ncbi:MAG: DUF4154 domain-containing protein [Bacteroidia bacterium]|nr:DUF4154 domain-containing protein [Bacteroidia bacterium]